MSEHVKDCVVFVSCLVVGYVALVMAAAIY